MPSSDKTCEICGEVVSAGHFSRHMSRWHSESSVDDSADEERQQPRWKDHEVGQRKRSGWNSNADQSPKIPRVHPVSEDYVRNAVL